MSPTYCLGREPQMDPALLMLDTMYAGAPTIVCLKGSPTPNPFGMGPLAEL